MRTLTTLLLIALLAVALAACDQAKESALSADYDAGAEAVSVLASEQPAAADAYYAEVGPEQTRAGNADNTTVGPIELPNAADARKIIYNAELQLVVDAFDGVPARVNTLAKRHGGFVARSGVHGSDGEPRHGEWTLRIPSTQFDTFVTGAQTLGQVRKLTSDSREVTAEYVDLEARVRNLRAEEVRLHKHLDQSTRSLDEILKVEREIARVRGEVERHEGRLNVLKDLTSLSTVTLTIEEIKDFVPAPTEDPGFGTQAARAWHGSVDGVSGLLSALSLAAVGLTPWLVVAAPFALVLWLVARRLYRQHANTARQTA